MLIFDRRKNKISFSSGGYSNDGLPIRDTYVILERVQRAKFQRAVLYEPIVKNEKSKIAVVIIHSDNDYSNFNMCGELAKRGYITLGGQVKNPDDTLDRKLLNIDSAVNFLRAYPGIEKVVLMGHSGGATLMSAYKAIAENGAEVFRGDHMLLKCSIDKPLADADGIMFIDSNWGNGAMTLFSLDPAVVEEGNGMKLNSEYDILDPKNGFDPNGSHYSEEFLKKYLAAQRARNNKLIYKALDRLHALENGKGFYNDDEPFIVTGGMQSLPCNKLFPTDLHLFAHTKKEYTLLHSDGSESLEIIRSVRPACGFGNTTSNNRRGTLVTTVRHYLSERSVLAGGNYNIKADGAEGIEWDKSYDCPPANVKHIYAPILCMGMTGSYEYLAAEEIYNNAPGNDKTIAFVEGASHKFQAIDEKYGDTERVLYDYIDRWLSLPGRFL